MGTRAGREADRSPLTRFSRACPGRRVLVDFGRRLETHQTRVYFACELGGLLLAARAAAMATAEQLRSLYRQAMPVGYACAQCVCPSWRWRCTMQRFRLSAETPSAAPRFFLCSHVRFSGVGDVSKTRWEAWEQFGAAWYGTAPLRPRRDGVRPNKLIKAFAQSLQPAWASDKRARLDAAVDDAGSAPAADVLGPALPSGQAAVTL